jgi:hypothetical protein
MTKLSKIFIFLFSFLAFNFVSVVQTYAVCPVCTVAVVAGLGLSRYLGIDDTVSGVWIGGVILSSSFWFIDWLQKKNFKWLKKYYEFKYWKYSVLLGMYALVLLPLFRSEIIGHPFNRLWGIDKLFLGISVGTGAFLLGMFLDTKAREKHGKQFFNFQKVVFPVVALVISSLIFFLITSVKIGLV